MSRVFLTDPTEGLFPLTCWLVVVPMIQVNLCRPACKENGLKFRHQLKGNLRELQKQCPGDAVEHCGQTAENKTPKQVISKAKSLPVRHPNSNPMRSQRAILFERRWSPLKIYLPPLHKGSVSACGRMQEEQMMIMWDHTQLSAVGSVSFLVLREHSQTLRTHTSWSCLGILRARFSVWEEKVMLKQMGLASISS